jgi:RecA-family ATPase
MLQEHSPPPRHGQHPPPGGGVARQPAPISVPSNMVPKPLSSNDDGNAFRRFANRGFSRLVPIVPPKAPISPRSSIYKRVGTPQDARGKVPGERNDDGLWRSFDWSKHEATADDFERWHDMGAGVGIKTGDGLVAIDADTLGVNEAVVVRDAIQRRFGRLPIRVGRDPKAIYLVRCAEPYKHGPVTFGQKDDKGRQTQRVEILSDGRQFVAAGVHPVTGKPYTWPRDVWNFEDIPVFTAADLDGLMNELATLLPDATWLPLDTAGITARGDVDQSRLRARCVEHVRLAVAAIPNDYDDRADYVKMGVAIKAALPDDPDEALEIFSEWCGRWTGGDNDRAVVEADWYGLKPPFGIGADYLYDLAERRSPHANIRARIYFEDLGDAPTAKDNPFRDLDSAPANGKSALRTLDTTSAATFADCAVPSREWLVEGMIPARNVTLLFGDGGTGKSLLALQLAIAASTNTEWIGLAVTPSPALFLSAEDDRDELQRRVSDIASADGLPLAGMADLHLATLAGEDAILGGPTGSDGIVRATPLLEGVRCKAREKGARLIVLDTLADIFGGDEIRRSQARQFISLLRGLAIELDAAVVVLGHPSQSGAASGAGTSGSTAWSNSVRSRLYFSRIMTSDGPRAVEGDPDARRLQTMKSNYGRVGQETRLRWEAGRFVRCGPVGANGGPADAGASAGADHIFRELLTAYQAEGRTVSATPSQNYAPVVFARDERAEGLSKRQLEGAMNRIFTAGEIVVAEVGPPSKRRKSLVFAASKQERPE